MGPRSMDHHLSKRKRIRDCDSQLATLFPCFNCGARYLQSVAVVPQLLLPPRQPARRIMLQKETNRLKLWRRALGAGGPCCNPLPVLKTFKRCQKITVENLMKNRSFLQSTQPGPAIHFVFIDLSVGENKSEVHTSVRIKVRVNLILLQVCLTLDCSFCAVHGGAATSWHQAANGVTATQWHEHVNFAVFILISI